MNRNFLKSFSIYLAFLFALALFAWIKPTEHFDRQLYGDAIRAAHGKIDFKFPEQIPLYSVKPLFVILAGWVGIRVLVVGSFVALGIVFWEWAGRRTVLCLLMMGSYIVIDAARMGTPDTLQSFLLILGAWLILEKGQFLGTLPLICAVWTRSDALIFCFLILLYGAWLEKIKVIDAVMTAAIAIISWMAINRFGYSYGYLLHSTMKTSYLRGLLEQATKSQITMLFPYALLGVIARKNPLVWIAGAGYAAHMLLFPNAESRYALPYILLVGVAFIKQLPDTAADAVAKDVVADQGDNLVSPPVSTSRT